MFEVVSCVYGARLALVFRNHARDGVCPYFRANRCHHCDIGAGEGAQGSVRQNLARLEYFARYYAFALPKIAHLSIYNSGSVLNPKEMPRELLVEIVEWAARLPCLQVLALDSRESYVTSEVLVAMIAHLGPGQQLRPILGIESVSPKALALLDKAMRLEVVERAFEQVGVAAKATAGRVGLDVNMLVGGPGVEPVEDAKWTAGYVFERAERAGIVVDLNLHAYYPSQRGAARFPGHPRCDIETLRRVIIAIHALKPATSSLFIGWQDEGHDREQERRRAEFATTKQKFDAFNLSQSLDSLA